jgi:hypothetical protein
VSLSLILAQQRDELAARLILGKVKWEHLIREVRRVEQTVAPRSDDWGYDDEQVWTFLLACAYAAVEGGASLLASAIIGEPFEANSSWLEVLPSSPRVREGSTNLDLALGTISRRGQTVSGIQLAETNNAQIVFCEFKWFSDIANNVSYDQRRNQLARVIENALLFRGATGTYPVATYVCLITPKIFLDRQGASRFYGYKWREYSAGGHQSLLDDLEDCTLDLLPGAPDIRSRIKTLRLRWTSFEDLASKAPPSPIREAFSFFYRSYAGSKYLDSWK